MVKKYYYIKIEPLSSTSSNSIKIFSTLSLKINVCDTPRKFPLFPSHPPPRIPLFPLPICKWFSKWICKWKFIYIWNLEFQKSFEKINSCKLFLGKIFTRITTKIKEFFHHFIKNIFTLMHIGGSSIFSWLPFNCAWISKTWEYFDPQYRTKCW